MIILARMVHQGAIYAIAPEAVVVNRPEGRRDTDTNETLRCMVVDMIKDEGEARGAIKLSGGSGRVPVEVDQL